MTTSDKVDSNSNITSYWYLRNAIGWIGLIMPFWVKMGALLREGVVSQTSISAYYYTCMRDVFVAALVLIGVLLACYRTDKLSDNIVAFIAGLAAVGIGVFPMNPEFPQVLLAQYPCLQDKSCYIKAGVLGYHFYFVAVFFALSFYMVFFRFSANTKLTPTPEKLIRNKIYKVCGAVMFVSFITIGYMSFTKNPNIYWPEYFAVAAFAIAWLVKGQALVWDRDNKPRILSK
jgi:hypothetical protein